MPPLDWPKDLRREDLGLLCYPKGAFERQAGRALRGRRRLKLCILDGLLSYASMIIHSIGSSE